MKAYISGSAWLSPTELATKGKQTARSSASHINAEAIQKMVSHKLPRMPEVALGCCVAVEHALLAAGFTVPLRDSLAERTALVMGNDLSSFRAVEELKKEAEAFGAARVNPAIFPNTVFNSLAGYVSIYTHIAGTNTSLSGGKFTIASSFMYGLTLLEKGEHDRVVICNAQLFPVSQMAESEQGTSNSLGEERITAFVLEHTVEAPSKRKCMNWEVVESTRATSTYGSTENEAMDISLLHQLADFGQLCAVRAALPNGLELAISFNGLNADQGAVHDCSYT